MTTAPRILLIEDNEQNRYLVSFLLEQHGCQVTHAGDGASGLALAEEGNFDLILLDIQLPVMDGHEVARALRKLVALHAVPIVAVTSYAMAGDKERILAEGCNGYLEKPIDPDSFVRDVMGFIEKESPGGEP